MLYVLYTIHIIVCIFLIMVVLLQRGKGADLSVFGGGSTQAAFGARGTASLLHKLTVSFFVLFILTTMTIAYLQGSRSESSVIDADAPVAEALEEAASDDVGAEGTLSGEPLADDAATGEAATAADGAASEPTGDGSDGDSADGAAPSGDDDTTSGNDSSNGAGS